MGAVRQHARGALPPAIGSSFYGIVRNIELKARLEDLDAARKVAETIATERLGTQRQVDTYFHCKHGRLKLREINAQKAELVWYARGDQPGPKASDYQLVRVPDPAKLKAALTAALGIRGVVEKRREIFLHDNVRIHLDDVTGLGRFLEFEAVLGPGIDDAAGRAQLDRLIERFAIAEADLLPGSYGDTLD